MLYLRIAIDQHFWNLYMSPSAYYMIKWKYYFCKNCRFFSLQGKRGSLFTAAMVVHDWDFLVHSRLYGRLVSILKSQYLGLGLIVGLLFILMMRQHKQTQRTSLFLLGLLYRTKIIVPCFLPLSSKHSMPDFVVVKLYFWFILLTRLPVMWCNK